MQKYLYITCAINFKLEWNFKRFQLLRSDSGKIYGMDGAG